MDLGGYLESFGAREGGRSEWILTCPRCDKAGHLYVNAEPSEGKNGRELPAGRFICHRCDFRGLRFAALVAELEGCSYAEAKRRIGKMKLDGFVWKRSAFWQRRIEPKGDRKEWLPPEFEPVYDQDADEWLWPSYLTTRGVPRELGIQLGLGVVRRHDKCDLCQPRRYCPNDFSHRVIIPIECPAGRSFTARTYRDDKLRYKAGPDAGQLLFGWPTMETSDKVVFVEGPFDAMKVMAAGLPVVALGGKSLKETQQVMLQRHRRVVTVLLDTDAGVDAIKIAKMFDAKVAVGLTKDPGDSSLDDIRRVIGQAKPWRDAQSEMLAFKTSKLLDRCRRQESYL